MNPSIISPTSSPASTLLYVDASPRGERSQSRALGQKFLVAWREAHPNTSVITRDVGREPPPFVTEAWVEGAFAPTLQQSPAAREAIAVSNQLIDELLSADQIVIATPLYNLSIPAVLKAWIDQIVRAGRTFAVQDGGYRGLAGGRRATVIVTSGGDFRPGTPAAGFNFLEPYLRAVLGFIGITEVEFVYAHSLAASEQVAEASRTAAHETLNRIARERAA
jgi:FMN-dependent NADH-azoreductase